MDKQRLDLNQLPLITADDVDINKPDVPMTCEEFEQGLLALEHMAEIDPMELFFLSEHVRTCSRREEHRVFRAEFMKRMKAKNV